MVEFFAKLFGLGPKSVEEYYNRRGKYYAKGKFDRAISDSKKGH